MAEWAILIMVFGVVGGAYYLNRRFFVTWQVAAIWVGAGLIITVGLIIYVSSKVDTATEPWADKYRIDEP